MAFFSCGFRENGVRFSPPRPNKGSALFYHETFPNSAACQSASQCGLSESMSVRSKFRAYAKQGMLFVSGLERGILWLENDFRYVGLFTISQFSRVRFTTLGVYITFHIQESQNFPMEELQNHIGQSLKKKDLRKGFKMLNQQLRRKKRELPQVTWCRSAVRVVDRGSLKTGSPKLTRKK